MRLRGGSVSGDSEEDVLNRYQGWLENLPHERESWTRKGFGLTIIEGTWTPETARIHCHDTNLPDDPPFIYNLGNGVWWIGGWCD